VFFICFQIFHYYNDRASNWNLGLKERLDLSYDGNAAGLVVQLILSNVLHSE
jgi:hypothetical protein